MASHTRGPRGRSRKPRPSAAQSDTVAVAGQEVEQQQVSGSARPREVGGARRSSKRRDEPASRGPGRAPVSPHRTFGERPPAPWHPLPLSELLILVGGVAFVIAVMRLRHGPSSGGPLLLAGILAVALGTIEVTWREHSSGYRSHTLLLALVPVLVLHSVVVLGYSFLAKPSELLNIGMFAVDIALFTVLFRLLRARFLDARARASGRG